MGSPTLATDATSSSISSPSDVEIQSSQLQARKPFGSNTKLEEKPVDFSRTVYGCLHYLLEYMSLQSRNY
uniref:Mitochondrial carrier protein n=1 Tax=Rhizophora mucronata TaxID=61149 RepID=A0A2P2JV75_RHIMU